MHIFYAERYLPIGEQSGERCIHKKMRKKLFKPQTANYIYQTKINCATSARIRTKQKLEQHLQPFSASGCRVYRYARGPLTAPTKKLKHVCHYYHRPQFKAHENNHYIENDDHAYSDLASHQWIAEYRTPEFSLTDSSLQIHCNAMRISRSEADDEHSLPSSEHRKGLEI